LTQVYTTGAGATAIREKGRDFTKRFVMLRISRSFHAQKGVRQAIPA
jgi:hypothetical protein